MYDPESKNSNQATKKYFKNLLKDIGSTAVILTIGAVGSTVSSVAMPVAVVASVTYVTYRTYNNEKGDDK